MDRETFLARVGRASLTSTLPDPPDVRSDLPEYPPGDLISLFRTRAQMVSAVVHGPVSRHGVPKVVVSVATGHDAGTFMSWDDPGVPGVVTALASAGLKRVDHLVPEDEPKRHTIRYRDLDVGVTGAVAGLAESGSLILTHGPGRPRMASLIPEVHIALLDVGTLTTTLAHWAHENPLSAAETTNLVVVTGPSRTADIEQQLNLGVHGPRHVHIVMIK